MISERWLLAGPPFGPGMWRSVRTRWTGDPSEAISLLELGGHPHEMIASLSARVRRCESGVVLVAHGLAVPVAMRVAAEVELEGLVLANGPIWSLDPVSRSLARVLRVPGSERLLRPSVLARALASSLALRRTVANPYVMDRDTVVALLDPLLEAEGGRTSCREFLCHLPMMLEQIPIVSNPVLGLWGDRDVLYPMAHADEARRWLRCYQLERVSGGRLFHPVERPWSFADTIVSWLNGELTAT